jgi:hypothetical protein
MTAIFICDESKFCGLAKALGGDINMTLTEHIVRRLTNADPSFAPVVGFGEALSLTLLALTLLVLIAPRAGG